jgi:hypothetical protein
MPAEINDLLLNWSAGTPYTLALCEIRYESCTGK